MPASSQLKYDALLGLCYMPAIVVICLPDFMFDRVPAASIIASGALTMTFGTNKTWGILPVAAAGNHLRAGILLMARLAGNMLPFYIAGTMLCAGLYTMMANVDSRVWLLRRFVEHAADRTVMVGAGGLIQILFLAVLFRRYHFNLREVPPPPAADWHLCGQPPANTRTKSICNGRSSLLCSPWDWR